MNTEEFIKKWQYNIDPNTHSPQPIKRQLYNDALSIAKERDKLQEALDRAMVTLESYRNYNFNEMANAALQDIAIIKEDKCWNIKA